MWEVLIRIVFWNVTRDCRNTQRFHKILLIIFTQLFACPDRSVKTDPFFFTIFCFISLFETTSQFLLPRFRTRLQNLHIKIFGLKFYELVALIRLFFLFEYIAQSWRLYALLLFQIHLAWKGIILRFLIVTLMILVLFWEICWKILLKTIHIIWLNILI